MTISRPQVGVLLLLAYAAVSDARWLYRAVGGIANAAMEDPVTRYEGRFRELRSLLPSRGVIGYVGDVQPEQYTSEDFKRFLLTEYALAPLLVVNDTMPDLVVGNFTPDRTPTQPPPGFQLVRKFDDGIWLLRRAR